jgi:hypothetical protein
MKVQGVLASVVELLPSKVKKLKDKTRSPKNNYQKLKFKKR